MRARAEQCRFVLDAPKQLQDQRATVGIFPAGDAGAVPHRTFDADEHVDRKPGFEYFRSQLVGQMKVGLREVARISGCGVPAVAQVAPDDFDEGRVRDEVALQAVQERGEARDRRAEKLPPPRRTRRPSSSARRLSVRDVR
jgi:hypothetical protein